MRREMKRKNNENVTMITKPRVMKKKDESEKRGRDERFKNVSNKKGMRKVDEMKGMES